MKVQELYQRVDELNLVTAQLAVDAELGEAIRRLKRYGRDIEFSWTADPRAYAAWTIVVRIRAGTTYVYRGDTLLEAINNLIANLSK